MNELNISGKGNDSVSNSNSNSSSYSDNYYNENEKLFIKSLIDKKDIKDCYTLAHKLQKEKCDMFELFWKIYIDYYAHINAKMEVFIIKKQNAWKNKKDINSILYVIKNMFISKSSTIVHDLRNYIMCGGLVTYIYNTKTTKTKYTNLQLALKNKHFENIAYELNKIVVDGNGNANANSNDNTESCVNELFDVIITHFSNYYGGAEKDKINEYWVDKRQHIPKHITATYLLALIMHLYEDENNISNTATFVVPRKEEIEFYSNLV